MMNNTSEPCAICRKRVYTDDQRDEPDDGFVEIEPESINVDDTRADDSRYVIHHRCWDNLADGWLESGVS